MREHTPEMAESGQEADEYCGSVNIPQEAFMAVLETEE